MVGIMMIIIIPLPYSIIVFMKDMRATAAIL
jgi:hypothetical protein